MEKGFTFVETLITVLLFSTVALGFYGVWHTGSQTYYADSSLLELQQQARNGLNRMVHETRQAYSVTAPASGASASSITMNTPSAAGVRYYLSGTNLVREYPSGTTNVIANNIAFLNFTNNSPMLKIEIRAEKVGSPGTELEFAL